MNRPSIRSMCFVSLSLLAACGGGGGGGGGSGGSADTIAPTAAITFPPATAITVGATVTIVGTAADNDRVSSVKVNGVSASTANQYAQWRATVPITFGANTFTVAVTDLSGNVNTTAASVDVTRTTEWAQRPSDVFYDTTASRLLFSDIAHNGVLAIGAADAISVLSSPLTGTGTVLSQPNELVGLGGTAFVGQNLESTIYSVDLTNGNRTALSGGAAGSGTAFVALFGLGVDASRNRLFALDFHNSGFPQSGRMFLVDTTTGARTLFTGGGAGSGDTFGLVNEFVHDTVNDRYITAGSANSIGQVLGIDPTSGARTELSGPNVGSGASLSGASDLVLPSGNTALVLTVPNTSNTRNLTGLLVAVDLTTGVRTAVTASGVGVQPTFASGSMSIDRDAATGDAYLSEFVAGKIYRLTFNSSTDIASVAEVEPAAASIGSGPKLLLSSGLGYDAAGRRAFVAERQPASITAFNLSNGVRSTFASVAVGAGTAPVQPRRVDWDSTNNRIIMVDGTSVFAVSNTGDRTLIVNDATLLPNSFPIMASAIDGGRNRILLGGSGNSAIVAVNLTTGAVSTLATLSTTNAGTGTVTGLAYLPASDRVVAADEDGNLFRVDGASGATTLVANGFALGLDQPGAMAGVSSTVIYVLDQLDAELFEFDIITGTRIKIFRSSSPGVHGAGATGGLAYDPATQVLYWTDTGIHGLSAFDRISGDRLVISR